MNAFDVKIFMKLYQHTAARPVLKQFMVMVTRISSKVFAGLYGLMILWLAFSNDPGITAFLVGPALSLGFVMLTRKLLSRRRPFETLDIESFVPHESGGSFPSKHASSAFVIALSIYHIQPVLGALAVLLAILTGLSRIMVGVHYPLDILGGMIVGVVFSSVDFWVL
jgi:undecaprenyl-diphosphatase